MSGNLSHVIGTREDTAVTDIETADAILTLSASHRRSLQAHDGLDNTRSVSFANGIDVATFPAPMGERDEKAVIYASSPDRGLEHLLRMWPMVVDAEPDASLHIFYDWTSFAQKHPTQHAALKQLLDETTSTTYKKGVPTVLFFGGVSHPDLHDHFRKAGILAYPNEGEVETFCITLVKALACGLQPVITDAGALQETSLGYFVDGGPDPVDRDVFLRALLTSLRRPWDEKKRVAAAEAVVHKYAWSKLAKKLVEDLETRRSML